MCVILVGNANKVYPLLDRAMDANPHGNGVAWIDNMPDGSGIGVRWFKGLREKDAKSTVKALGELPVIFHARISTVGGTGPLLCHPFPVQLKPKLSLEGMDDMVLFHNGHFSGWEKFAPEDDVKEHKFLWSDSRAVAHGLATGAINLSDLGNTVSGVYAVLSTKPFEGDRNVGTIEYYGKWIDAGDGVQASNLNFLNNSRSGGYYWEFSKCGSRRSRYPYWWDDEDTLTYYPASPHKKEHGDPRVSTRKPVGYEYDRHSYRYSG